MNMQGIYIRKKEIFCRLIVTPKKTYPYFSFFLVLFPFIFFLLPLKEVKVMILTLKFKKYNHGGSHLVKKYDPPLRVNPFGSHL